MVYSSRRYHKKSRNGCLQCKQRHVKCDSRGPRCHACVRRNTLCEYVDLTDSPSQSIQSLSSDLQSRPSPSSRTFITTGPYTLQPPQLQLLHHWIAETSSTIGLVSGPDIEQIWRVVVPGHGQNHPFLAHSIFAITAAHMAHLHTNTSQNARYSDIARRYSVNASALFRSCTVADLRRLSLVPTLAFLILMGLTTLSLLQGEEEYLDRFLDILNLTRHSLRLGNTYGTPAANDFTIAHILVASELKPEGLLSLDEQLQSSLDNLNSVNLASPSTSKFQKAILTHAIEQTQEWYSCVPLYPQNLVFTPHWVMLMTDDFLVYLRDKNEVAIALLAHWIVPLYNAPRKWYMSEWPQNVVASIAKELGPTKTSTIEWVLSQVPIPIL